MYTMGGDASRRFFLNMMSGSSGYSQKMNLAAVFMVVLLCTLNVMSKEGQSFAEAHQDDPPL